CFSWVRAPVLQPHRPNPRSDRFGCTTEPGKSPKPALHRERSRKNSRTSALPSGNILSASRAYGRMESQAAEGIWRFPEIVGCLRAFGIRAAESSHTTAQRIYSPERTIFTLSRRNLQTTAIGR